MNIRIITSCVVLLTMTGCASNTEEVTSAQTSQEESVRDDGYQCKRETVTGSRFPIKRCTTAFQRQREAEEAREAMSRSRSGTGKQVGN